MCINSEIYRTICPDLTSSQLSRYNILSDIILELTANENVWRNKYIKKEAHTAIYLHSGRSDRVSEATERYKSMNIVVWCDFQYYKRKAVN